MENNYSYLHTVGSSTPASAKAFARSRQLSQVPQGCASPR